MSLHPSLSHGLFASPRSLALSPGCCHCLGDRPPSPQRLKWPASPGGAALPGLPPWRERSLHPWGCGSGVSACSRSAPVHCASLGSESSQAGLVGVDLQKFHSQLVLVGFSLPREVGVWLQNKSSEFFSSPQRDHCVAMQGEPKPMTFLWGCLW